MPEPSDDDDDEEGGGPFGWLLLLVFIAFSILASARTTMRGIGLLLTLGVLWSWRKKRIPFGWEGRPASGYIAGWPALVFKIAFALLGLVIAVWPEPFMAFLDWHET